MDPTDLGASNIVADCLYSMEKYEEAIELLNKTIKSKPTEENLLLKGKCLLELSK